MRKHTRGSSEKQSIISVKKMNISPLQYARLLLHIEQEVHNEKEREQRTQRLAKILLKNKDQKKLAAIERAYSSEKVKISGEILISVTSATELSGDEKEKIKAEICSSFDISREKAILENEVDRDLIGGIIIRIGNEVIDGSLRTKIKKISQSLT